MSFTDLLLIRHCSIKVRLIAVIAVLVILVTLAVLVGVQRGSFAHSTRVIQDNAELSLKNIVIHFKEQSERLQEYGSTISTQFSLKSLIANGARDKESLDVAMQNFSSRFGADYYAIYDAQDNLVVSSLSEQLFKTEDLETLYKPTLHWYIHDQLLYFVTATQVKNTPRSLDRMGTIVFGHAVPFAMSEDISRLSNMDISIVAYDQGSSKVTVMSSTYKPDIVEELKSHTVEYGKHFQSFQINGVDYLALSEKLYVSSNKEIYLLLSMPKQQAYLSYQTLLSHIVVLVFIVLLLVLYVAAYFAKEITQPINELIKVANDIRQDKSDIYFPKHQQKEVSELSDAMSSMHQQVLQRDGEIRKLAFFDSITHLSNRTQFEKELKDLFLEHSLNLVIVDIRRFKEINETIGHSKGDQLLKLFADRLVQNVPKQSLVSRLGSDEFAIASFKNSSLTTLLQDLHLSLEAPFVVDGLELQVYTSMGGACSLMDNIDSSDLLMQAAGVAQDFSKQKNRAYVVFEPDMIRFSSERLRLVSALKSAIDNSQLQLHLQAKQLLENDHICAVECLARWHDSQAGNVYPDVFIELAEQTGMITKLTLWAIDEALRMQAVLNKQGYQLNFAINISAFDVSYKEFPNRVMALLKKHKADPKKVILEVTESAVMTDPTIARSCLESLHEMGLKLSIDDFGTGYSSLSQLKQLPVSELKIDRTFVMNMVDDENDKNMVSTMVALAKNLNLSTVAEGVECEHTKELLKQIGCTQIQGYYLSKPLPFDDFQSWISAFLNTLSTEQN